MKSTPLGHDSQYLDRMMQKVENSLHLGSLVENLSTGIILVDGEGIVRYLNHKIEQMLQISRDDVVGKQVYQLPLRTPIYKVLSENCRDHPIEMSLQGLVIQAKATSVICPEGGYIGDMYELRDITTERQERRRSDEFVAAMTHDLKSPLTVLFGYLDAMRHNAATENNERMTTCIYEMEKSGSRLLGMIEDILDSYRLDVGILQIQCDFCDLRQLLENCCREFEVEASSNDLIFSYDIDPNIPACRVDMKQITRVLANLIGNAIKFTPHGGSVKVEAVAKEGEVLIMVSDTGIGIPAKDHQRVFGKYFRSRLAQGYKGTGLGLSIAKAIVEGHGGTIEIESSEGKGSSFTVRLPIDIST